MQRQSLTRCPRRQLHRLQSVVAPLFDLEAVVVSYEEIVDVFMQCVDCVCGCNHRQQQQQQQQQQQPQQQAPLRCFVVNCMAALLLQECEDMCAANAPLTLETASVICTRIGQLRGRLMRGENDGGAALDVSVCLRSVAVAAVLTVTNARHAADFVAATASASADATKTPLKCSAKRLSSLSCTAALADDHDLFADDVDGVSGLLSPPLPLPLTPACAKQFLSFRKDIRCKFVPSNPTPTPFPPSPPRSLLRTVCRQQRGFSLPPPPQPALGRWTLSKLSSKWGRAASGHCFSRACEWRTCCK